MDHHESSQSVFSTLVSISIVDQPQTGEYESIADFRRGSLFRVGGGEGEEGDRRNAARPAKSEEQKCRRNSSRALHPETVPRAQRCTRKLPVADAVGIAARPPARVPFPALYNTPPAFPDGDGIPTDCERGRSGERKKGKEVP